MHPTVKITIEGDPETVEAIAARLAQFLTVTYVSKDLPKRFSNDVSRYLRVLPPGQAHQPALINARSEEE